MRNRSISSFSGFVKEGEMDTTGKWNILHWFFAQFKDFSLLSVLIWDCFFCNLTVFAFFKFTLIFQWLLSVEDYRNGNRNCHSKRTWRILGIGSIYIWGCKNVHCVLLNSVFWIKIISQRCIKYQNGIVCVYGSEATLLFWMLDLERSCTFNFFLTF